MIFTEKNIYLIVSAERIEHITYFLTNCCTAYAPRCSLCTAIRCHCAGLGKFSAPTILWSNIPPVPTVNMVTVFPFLRIFWIGACPIFPQIIAYMNYMIQLGTYIDSCEKSDKRTPHKKDTLCTPLKPQPFLGSTLWGSSSLLSSRKSSSSISFFSSSPSNDMVECHDLEHFWSAIRIKASNNSYAST